MSASKSWIAAALIALAGCSDSGGGNPPPPDGTITQDTGQPPTDGAVPTGDGSSAGCKCNANEICTTDGTCVAKPQPSAGQIHGELILLRQVSPMSTGITAALAKAEVLLADWAPLPADTRTHWTTQDPEGDCAYEIDTTYPYYYDGKSWPPGDGLGAGKITFKPQGAPAPGLIEMDPFDTNPGYFYTHGSVPPPLKEGAATYPDFFDAANVPYGARYEVDFAGGPDIGAMTITGGETAQAFTITGPEVEKTGATASPDVPLKITWSPAQPGATMEIFITQSLGPGGVALLTCTVPDDGETTIRVPALASFLGDVGVQLRRTVERYKQVQTTGGKTMHLHIMGRHARLGKLSLSK